MRALLERLRAGLTKLARYDWPIGLAATVFYVWASLSFTDFRDMFEVNPDEGIELTTALLLDHGFKFGAEIWSSHPPLFHHLLWACFELFGWELEVARVVMLYLSAILVFAVYESVRLLSGQRVGRVSAHICGLAAVLFLLTAHLFANLRVAVMIGQPAIAFAALALWAALHAGLGEKATQSAHGRRRVFWILTGVFFAASVSIKAFTGFLWPTVALTALAPELVRLRRREWKPLLAGVGWLALGLFPALLIFCAPILATGALEQLYSIHVLANSEYKTRWTLRGLLERDLGMFLFAGAGALLAAVVRFAGVLPWVAWLGSALLVLSLHDPLWDHYNQLLIVPGAALAGLTFAVVAPLLPRAAKVPWAVLLAPVLVGACWLSKPERVHHLRVASLRGAERTDRAVLRALKNLDVPDGFIVTSNQIFAFLLKRPVPPLLAGTPAKRFAAAQLDAPQIIQQIDKYRPKLVILSKRWPEEVRDPVRRALQGRYERVYHNRKYRDFEVFTPVSDDP